MESSRRRFLAVAAAAVGIAGCQTGGGGSGASTTATDAKPTDPRSVTARPSPTATRATTTAGRTATATETVESAVAAGDLDRALADRGVDEATLELRPADPDADYAVSVVFEAYDGHVPVAVDLDRALRARHYDHPTVRADPVATFWQRADDPAWRESIHEAYLRAVDGDDPHQLQREVDWARYLKGRSLGTRFGDSGVHDLWQKYAVVTPGLDDISTANNAELAAAYQHLDRVHGFETFFWDHEGRAPDGTAHGLVAAVEAPTRDEGEVGDQATYVVEPGRVDGAVTPVERSRYFAGDRGQGEPLEHPAEHDFDDAASERAMYTRTALAPDEDALAARVGSVDEDLVHAFTDEWFRKPATAPAFDYVDRMATAAYLAEKTDGQVRHTRSTLTYNAPG